MIDLDRIRAAARALDGVVVRTPVLGEGALDARAGGRLLFKLESLQRSGAFKLRGAWHALFRNEDAARARGVVTGSSGNHGTALAMAARMFGARAVVVMPEDAVGAKVAAVREQGGEVVFCGRSSAERLARAAELAARDGLFMVPPYDHEDVIAGQGTVGLEILEQVPEVEVVLVPCGGGGLLAGVATAIASERPDVEVWGVEAEGADDFRRSFALGERVEIPVPGTIADGIRNVKPGALTFPLVRRHARGIALVSDDEIAAAVAALATRLRIVAEPTGAVAPAAALFRKVPLEGRTAVAVVSGGNADPAAIARFLAS